MSQPMHAVVHLAGGVTACHEAHLRYPVAPASNSPVKKQPCACHRAPRSESTADKPSETKAFPQPSSAPPYFWPQDRAFTGLPPLTATLGKRLS